MRTRTTPLLLSTGVAAALALVGPATGAQAHTAAPQNRPGHDVMVSVGGDVAMPATYDASQIAALTQVTLPIAHPRKHGPTSVTGASLEDLVNASTPNLPAVKNGFLRVAITVRGDHGAVTLAEGELDASFGNNPALLTVTDGPCRRTEVDLVVPGDQNRSRTITDVRSVSVAVSAATPTVGATPGDVVVTDGSRSRTVSAATLAGLPSQTLTVSFLAGTASQTHTETGPSLKAVLKAAHIRLTPTTSVAGVGDDGYVAVVTPAEQPAAGKPLMISLVEDGIALTEPRLVVDGDVKGGRYVSGLLDLVVSR